MIITRLINNLKCLISKSSDLEARINTLEVAELSPFQVSITTVDTENGNEVIMLPVNIQLISMFLVRTSAPSTFEDYSISHYTQSATQLNTVITVFLSGDRNLAGYEIHVVYRFA
jgi:hypothetical protein